MKKTHKQLILGIIISGVFLWLAFRRVPLSDLWSFLKTINYWWTIPLAVLLIISMYWRAVRWRLLLPATRDISSGRLFGPLIIGFGLNNIFPARAGEFLRPLALAKQDGVPFGEGMGTVVIERLFDGIMLLLLFFVVLFFMPFDDSIMRTWDARQQYSGADLNLALSLGLAVAGLACLWLGMKLRARERCAGDSAARTRHSLPVGILAAVLLLGALLCALFPVWNPASTVTFGQQYELSGPAIKSLARKTSLMIAVLLAGVIAMMFRPVQRFFIHVLSTMPGLPGKLRALLISLLESFAAGLNSLRDPVRIFWIFIHSIIVWVMVAVGFWITSIGIPGLQLTFLQSLAFLVITCVAIAIPAAPGYWGLYEVGGVVALMLTGVTRDASAALGFTLVVHFAQWVPITLLGLYYAAKIHVSPSEPLDPDSMPDDVQKAQLPQCPGKGSESPKE